MKIIDYDTKYSVQCNNCLLEAWQSVINRPQYSINYIQKHTNANHLKTNLNRIALSTVNSEVIGIIYCKLICNELYIKHLAVLPSYQGRGIAFALLNNVKQYASDHNMKRMWLYTEEFNEKAIKFYERYGFVMKQIVEIVPNKEYSNLYEYIL